MSIQTTIGLKRTEAEDILLRKRLEDKDLIRKIRSEIVGLTDEQIEDELEEEFYNYCLI